MFNSIPTTSTRAQSSGAVRGTCVLALFALFTLPMLGGCAADATTEQAAIESTTDSLRTCRTDKMDFTRETGCQNDGSVELCVPAGDLKLQARIKAIAPEVTFVSSGGRARCNVATELLALYPTRQEPGGACDASGTLTCSAWGDLCAIAAERKVRRIVPTFFE